MTAKEVKAEMQRIRERISSRKPKRIENEDPREYDFEKFNNITTVKEFQDAQNELEDKLEDDGVIDEYEDKLEALDKKFAELMSKELV